MQWVDEHFLRPLQRKIFKNFGYYDYSRQTFCVNAVHVNHLLDGELDPETRRARRQNRREQRAPLRGGRQAGEESTLLGSQRSASTPAAPSDLVRSARSNSTSDRAEVPGRSSLETSEGKIRLSEAEIKSAGLLSFLRRITGKALSVDSVHVVLDFIRNETAEADAQRHSPTARPASGGGDHVDGASASEPATVNPACPGEESQGSATHVDEASGEDAFSESSSAFAPPQEAGYEDEFSSEEENGAHDSWGAGEDEQLLFRSCASSQGAPSASAAGYDGDEADDALFVSAMSDHTLDASPQGTDTQSATTGSTRTGATAPPSPKERFRTVGDVMGYVKRPLQGVTVSIDAFHLTLRIPPRGQPLRRSLLAKDPSVTLPNGTIVLHVTCTGGVRGTVDRVSRDGDEVEATVSLGDWRVYVHEVGSRDDTATVLDLCSLKQRVSALVDFSSLPLEDLVAAATHAAAGPSAEAAPPPRFSHTVHIAHVTRPASTPDVEAHLGTSPLPTAATSVTADPFADPGDPVLPRVPVTERRLHVSATAACVTAVLTPLHLARLLRAADAVLGLPLPTGASSQKATGASSMENSTTVPAHDTTPAMADVDAAQDVPGEEGELDTTPLLDANAFSSRRADRAALHEQEKERLREQESLLFTAASRKIEAAALAATASEVARSKKYFKLTLPSATLTLPTGAVCDDTARQAVKDAWRRVFPDRPTFDTATPTDSKKLETEPAWVRRSVQLREPFHTVLSVPHFTVAIAGVDVLFPNVDAVHAFPTETTSGGEEVAVMHKKKLTVMQNLFKHHIADQEVTAMIEASTSSEGVAYRTGNAKACFAGVESFQLLEYRGLGTVKRAMPPDAAATGDATSAPSAVLAPTPTPLLSVGKAPYALVALLRSVSTLTQGAEDTTKKNASGAPPAPEREEHKHASSTEQCLHIHKECAVVLRDRLRVEIDPDLFVVTARYARGLLARFTAMGDAKASTGDRTQRAFTVPGEVPPPSESAGTIMSAAAMLPRCRVETHYHAKLLAEFVDGRVRFPIPQRRRYPASQEPAHVAHQGTEENDEMRRQTEGERDPGAAGTWATAEDRGDNYEEDFDEEYGELAEMARRPLLQRLLRHLSAKSRRYFRETAAASTQHKTTGGEGDAVTTGSPQSAPPPLPWQMALEELCFSHESASAEQSQPRFLPEGLGVELVDLQLTLEPKGEVALKWREAVAAIVDPVAPAASAERQGLQEGVVGHTGKKSKSRSTAGSHFPSVSRRVAMHPGSSTTSTGVSGTVTGSAEPAAFMTTPSLPLMRGDVKELVRVDYSEDMRLRFFYSDLIADKHVVAGPSSMNSLDTPLTDSPTALRHVLTVSLALGEVVTQPLTQDDVRLTLYFVKVLKGGIARARRLFPRQSDGADATTSGSTHASSGGPAHTAPASVPVEVTVNRCEQERLPSIPSGGAKAPTSSTISMTRLLECMETDEGLAELLQSTMHTSEVKPKVAPVRDSVGVEVTDTRGASSTGGSSAQPRDHNAHGPTRAGNAFRQAADTGSGEGSDGRPAVWWNPSASAVYCQLHIRRVTLNLLAPRLSPEGTALGEPMLRCLADKVAATTDLSLLYHRYQLDVSRFALAYLSCDDPAVLLRKKKMNKDASQRFHATQGQRTLANSRALPSPEASFEDVCLGSTMDVIVRVTSLTFAEDIAPLQNRKTQGSLVNRTEIVQSYTGNAHACPPDTAGSHDTPSTAKSRPEEHSGSSSLRGWVLVDPETRAPPSSSYHGTDHVCRVCVTGRPSRSAGNASVPPPGQLPDERIAVVVDIHQVGLHHLPHHMGDSWLAVLKNFFVDRVSSAEEAAKEAACTGSPTAPAPGEVGKTQAAHREETLNVCVTLRATNLLWAYRPQGPHTTLVVMLAPGLRLDIHTPDFVLNPVISIEGHVSHPASFFMCHDCEIEVLGDSERAAPWDTEGVRPVGKGVSGDGIHGVLNRTGQGWAADLSAYGFLHLLDVYPNGIPSVPCIRVFINRAPHCKKPVQIRVTDLHVSASVARDSLHEAIDVGKALASGEDLRYVELPHRLVIRSNTDGAMTWVGQDVKRRTAPMVFRIDEGILDGFLSSENTTTSGGGEGAHETQGEEAVGVSQGRRRAFLTSFPSVQSTSTMSSITFLRKGAREEPITSTEGQPEGSMPPSSVAEEVSARPSAEAERVLEDAAAQQRRFRLWRRSNAPRDVLLYRAYEETMQTLLRTPWPPDEDTGKGVQTEDSAAAATATAVSLMQDEEDEWMDLLLADPQLYRRRRAARLSATDTRVNPDGGATHRARPGQLEADLIASASTSSFESIEENPMAVQPVLWRFPGNDKSTVAPTAATDASFHGGHPPLASPIPPHPSSGFDLSEAVMREPHYMSGLLHEPPPAAVGEPIDVERLEFYSVVEQASMPTATTVPPYQKDRHTGSARSHHEERRRNHSASQMPGLTGDGEAVRRILPPVDVELFICRCSLDVGFYDGNDLADAATRKLRRGFLDVACRGQAPPSARRPPPAAPAFPSPSPAGDAARPGSPASPTTAHREWEEAEALKAFHQQSRPSTFGERQANKCLVLRARGVSVQVDLFAFGYEEQRWLHAVVEQATIFDCIAKSDVRTLMAASPARPGDWVYTSRFLELSWLNLVPRHASALHGGRQRDDDPASGGGAVEGWRGTTALAYGSPEEEISIRLQPLSVTWSGASLDFLLRLTSVIREDSESTEGQQIKEEALPPHTAGEGGPLEVFLPPPFFFRAFTVHPTVITLSGSFDSDAGFMNALQHGRKLDVVRNLPLLSWVSVKRLPLTIPHITVTDCGTPALLLERIVADSQCLSIRFLLTLCCCVVQPLNAAAKVGEAAKGVLLTPMASYRRSDSIYHALARASTTLASELVSQSAHIGSMLTNNTYRASRALMVALLGDAATGMSRGSAGAVLTQRLSSPQATPPVLEAQAAERALETLPPSQRTRLRASSPSTEGGSPIPGRQPSLDLYVDPAGDGGDTNTFDDVPPPRSRRWQPSTVSEGVREGHVQVQSAVRDAADMLTGVYSIGADGALVQLPAAGLRVLMGLSSGATAALRGVRNASSTQQEVQARSQERWLYKDD